MKSIDEYVESGIERIPETGCWIWTKALSHNGYASGCYAGKTRRIHRWLYKVVNGDIGDLTLDHLCRVRCCVNPAHLDPVSNKENLLRGIGFGAINAKKTHCKNGHVYDGVRKRLKDGTTFRFCKICHREWNRLNNWGRKPKNDHQ